MAKEITKEALTNSTYEEVLQTVIRDEDASIEELTKEIQEIELIHPDKRTKSQKELLASRKISLKIYLTSKLKSEIKLKEYELEEKEKEIKKDIEKMTSYLEFEVKKGT